MRGSKQLIAYLRYRRNGTPTDSAAAMAGIGLIEAQLHDKDEAQGLYDDISTKEETNMDDGIFAGLAVNLSEDMKAEKKRRGRPPKSQSAPGVESTTSQPQESAVSDGETGDERITETVQSGGETIPIEAKEFLEGHVRYIRPTREGEIGLGGDLAGWTDETSHHGGHEANLDHLATIADDYIADPSALLGSFREITLELFKNRRMPWHGMSPQEQRDTVAAIDYAGRKIIQEMVVAVAGKNRPSIPAHFKKLSDDGNKMTLTVEVTNATREDENALHASLRSQVVIVPADWSFYDRVKRDPVDAEEPELAFDAPKPAEPTRAEVMGFDSNPPAHPADDSDLAGDDEIVEDIAALEEAAPVRDDAATWVVTDLDEGETVYLTAEQDAWTANEAGAGKFLQQQAADLAFENDAQAVNTAA